jgi:plasmid stabilization system protein ParE
MANRVCRAIYDAVQILGRYPEMGRVGIESGTRELVVPSFPMYIVVYRVIDSVAVQVLRVWHGAQERAD